VRFWKRLVPDGGWFGYANLTSAPVFPDPPRSNSGCSAIMQSLGISSMLSGLQFLGRSSTCGPPAWTPEPYAVLFHLDELVTQSHRARLQRRSRSRHSLMFERLLGTLLYSPPRRRPIGFCRTASGSWPTRRLYSLSLPRDGIVSGGAAPFARKPHLRGDTVSSYSGSPSASAASGCGATTWFSGWDGGWERWPTRPSRSPPADRVPTGGFWEDPQRCATLWAAQSASRPSLLLARFIFRDSSRMGRPLRGNAASPTGGSPADRHYRGGQLTLRALRRLDIRIFSGAYTVAQDHGNCSGRAVGQV